MREDDGFSSFLGHHENNYYYIHSCKVIAHTLKNEKYFHGQEPVQLFRYVPVA